MSKLHSDGGEEMKIRYFMMLAALMLMSSAVYSVPPDLDSDNDGDQDDFGLFQVCFTGADNVPPASGCETADFDQDRDVDPDDYVIFQMCASGPDIPISSQDCIDYFVDTDGDGIYDPNDNCLNTPNPDQVDSDGDGLGNLCDACLSHDQIPEACFSLVTLQSITQSEIQELIAYIQSLGAEVTQVYHPRVMITSIQRYLETDVRNHAYVMELYYDPIDPAVVAPLGPEAVEAATYYNAKLSGEADIPPIDPNKGPVEGDIQEELGGARLMTIPHPMGQTSEYMIGDVGYRVIFVESDGTIDPNEENWTQGERDRYTTEVGQSMNWWTNRWKYTRTGQKLVFHNLGTQTAQTSYEPISRAGGHPDYGGEDDLWIQEIMDDLGYDTYGNYLSNVRNYADDLRDTNNLDWVFIIFGVDASKDGNHKFSNDKHGYARLEGPFTVIPIPCDGYENKELECVIAHEMGHIFDAADGYRGSWTCDEDSDCTAVFGWLNVQNQNCNRDACTSDKACIMRGQWKPYDDNKISSTAKGQIGWRDTDGDGILDPIDTQPTITMTAPTYNGECIADNTPTFQGNTTDTENAIMDVAYTIDHTNWVLPSGYADAVDGSYDTSDEDFSFTTPVLANGSHIIRIRPYNTVVNWSISWATITVHIDVTPPTIVSSLQSTSHTEEVWDNDNTIQADWQAASDQSYGTCGVDGYSVEWDTSMSTTPDDIIDLNSSAISHTSPAVIDSDAHYFHIKAIDKAGNVGAVDHLGPFYIDTHEPSSPTYNTAEDQWFSIKPASLDIDFSDTFTLDNIYYSIDSGSSWTSIASAVGDNTYTTNWTLTDADWNLMADGTHNLYFKVTDEAGNEYETPDNDAGFTLHKDTTNPNAPNYITVEDGWYNLNPLLDIDFYDNLEIDDIQYRVDNAGSWLDIATDVGAQSYTSDWSMTDWASTSQGTHYIYFQITDVTGNTYTTPDNDAAFKFNKDVTAPSSPTYNTAEGSYYSSTAPTLDIDFSDNLELDSVACNADNVLPWRSIATDINGSSYTTNWQVSVALWNGLSEGQHELYFKIVDDAGNEYITPDDPAGFTIWKDTIPPIADAGPDQTVMVGEMVSFDGTDSTDENWIDEYSWDFDISDGIQNDASGATPTHSYGSFGDYTVTLTVEDPAGNSDTDTMIVHVKIKPVAYIDSITPNPATRGEDISFTGHGTDADGIVNGWDWYSDIEGNLSNLATFSREMVDGNHTIEFKVKDDDDYWSDVVTWGLNVYLPPDWPMFHKEVARKGSTSPAYSTPDQNYALMWKDITFNTVSSPVIANIDNDWSNGLEIVVGANDNNVYAFDSSGTQLWSYATGGVVESTPAIGNLDNNLSDGLEIVVGSNDGKVYALTSSGGLEWASAYTTGGAVKSSPAIADLDSDGNLEIIVGSNDTDLYILNKSGGKVCSCNTGGNVDSSPAIGDIDQTKAGLEIAVGSDDMSVYVIDKTCTSLASFATGGAVDSSPALGDINGDGLLEIVVGSDDSNVYALRYLPGNPAVINQFWVFATGAGFTVDSSPALYQWEPNQWLIAVGSSNGNVYALTQNGAQFASSPFATGAAVDSSPAIADIKNALLWPEVIVGSDSKTLYAINFFTNPATLDWQYVTNNNIDSSPAVADIDHDGELEIAIANSLYVLEKKAFINIQPNPDPGGPYNVASGGSATLDASMSDDPNEPEGDEIVGYEWDLDNNGSFSDATDREGEIVNLSWSEIQSTICTQTVSCINNNPYPITLRVTDSYGATATATTDFTITGPGGPIANPDGPYDIMVGEPLLLDASGSTGTIDMYVWDLNNDDIDDEYTQNPDLFLPYSDVQSRICGGSCIPEMPYTVKLTVQGPGGEDEDTTTVTVHNQP
jgi:hypothetical protein